MLASSTSNRSTEVVALLLLAAQTAMVAVLIATVSSDWYSVYFRKMTRPEKLEPATLRRNYAQTKDSELRAVYLNGLIRSELESAESAFKYKNFAACAQALDAAQKDIGEQVDLNYAPQRVWLERLLATSIKLKQATGDKSGAARLQALRADLQDPVKAQKYFASSNLRGFESSYPQDFRAGYNLMQLDALLINDAHKEQALVLWWNQLHDFHPQTKEQAETLFKLRVATLDSRSPEKIHALRNQLLEAIQKDLLLRFEAQTEFDYFIQDRMFANEWPPSGPGNAANIVKQVDLESKICEAQHLDDTALRIARAQAFVTLGEHGKARGLFMPILAHPDSWGANDLLSIQLSNTIIDYCNEVGRAGGDASKRLIIPLLEDALSVTQFTGGPRANLLLRIAHEYRSAGNKSKANEYYEQAWKAAPNGRGFDPSTFEFTRIKNCIEDLEFEKGEALYSAALQKYKGNLSTLQYLTSQLLGYWRSIPNIAAPAHKQLTPSQFPERAFLDALTFTEKRYGSGSNELRRVQLWLAQYYDCKNDKTLATKYVESALDDTDATRFGGYFAADDLLSELTHQRPPEYIDSELTHAKAGNIVELECQISLYKQLQRDTAAARLESLKARIHEQ